MPKIHALMNVNRARSSHLPHGTGRVSVLTFLSDEIRHQKLKMDPFTAIGLAGTIVTFVDVGLKVLNKARKNSQCGVGCNRRQRKPCFYGRLL